VTKVHLEVTRYAREGYSVILIGHRNHDEVIGTFGEAPNSIHLVSTLEEVDTLNGVRPDRWSRRRGTQFQYADHSAGGAEVVNDFETPAWRI